MDSDSLTVISALLPLLPGAVMAVTDLRYRWVSLPAMSAYLLCCAVSGFVVTGPKASLLSFASCLAVSLLFAAALLIYYRARTGKWGGILDVRIGWGDVLFFLGAGFLMSAEQFCLFVSAGCLAGIVWHRMKAAGSIPLVGLCVPLLALFQALKLLTDYAT